jgi:hypothetical protein
VKPMTLVLDAGVALARFVDEDGGPLAVSP